MRRVQKNQLIELINMMVKAQESVASYDLRSQSEAVLLLLSNCQNTAISVGNTIEESEGEGTRTVALLEKYCEGIFQIYQSVETGAEDIAEENAQLLLLLVDVINSIENDIPRTKEIVFLPYMASMWDSLESVWKKKSQEDNCECFVIPIPYFEKNPDDTLGTMHYEGNQYPDYVEVTSYESYNIQANHPDEIYIHNPYDANNFVTSVHPAFYAEKLKDYTDKLVYIPYFVLEEVDPRNKAAVSGIAHFAKVPGVVYAHEVILQSENMRLAYIEILTEAFGEHTRQVWETKIKGTGSPKLDKIKNMKQECCEIPAQWQAKIKKADGNNKKIILYNTSIAALLEEDKRMLDKMKRVFDFFEGQQDKVTLLWRPHPLIQSTIASLRPVLWQEYQEIVSDYQKRNFGIYDDSPELDRAIAICDAYYGDPSSLVQLCKQAQKPIMIQNCNVE